MKLKISNTAKLAVFLVGLELLREWFFLKNMGFEPGRFAQWLRGDEDGSR